jgi:Fic family protein
MLEGNPYTFPEVKTLLEGVTVGGRSLSDQEQILNLAEGSRRLLALVRSGQFQFNKAIFTELHRIVARNEALEWGIFRGEGEETNYTPEVGLGEFGRYTPLPTTAGGSNLNRTFTEGTNALEKQVVNPFEKATAFFLFGALQQFFFDGNKRTSRSMMNGVLMSNGIDAISVPAAKKQEFNEKMVRFYLTKDGSEMMTFLVDCHPEVEQIRKTNPNLRSPGESEKNEHDDSGMRP